MKMNPNYCDQHKEMKWEVRILFLLMGLNEGYSILTGSSLVADVIGLVI